MVALYFINSICTVLPSCEPFVTALPPHSTAKAPVTLGQAHQWPEPRWLPSPEPVSQWPAATDLQTGPESEWGPTDLGWGWGPGLLGLGSRQGLGRGCGVGTCQLRRDQGWHLSWHPSPTALVQGQNVCRGQAAQCGLRLLCQAELALEQHQCGAGAQEGAPGGPPKTAPKFLTQPLLSRPSWLCRPGPWALGPGPLPLGKGSIHRSRRPRSLTAARPPPTPSGGPWSPGRH